LGLLAVLGVVVIVPLVNASSPPPAIAEHVLAGHTDTVWSLSTTQLDGRPVIVSGSVGDHEIPQLGGVGDHVIPHPAIT